MNYILIFVHMNIFQQHLTEIEAALPEILDKMLVTSRLHFDQSWTDKGFTDENLDIWQPVIDRRTGAEKSRPLVDTGRLRRSLKTSRSGLTGTVYTDVPYAEYHNEGTDTLPQRQFMGPSAQLDEKCIKIATDTLNDILS